MNQWGHIEYVLIDETKKTGKKTSFILALVP